MELARKETSRAANAFDRSTFKACTIVSVRHGRPRRARADAVAGWIVQAPGVGVQDRRHAKCGAHAALVVLPKPLLSVLAAPLQHQAARRGCRGPGSTSASRRQRERHHKVVLPARASGLSLQPLLLLWLLALVAEPMAAGSVRHWLAFAVWQAMLSVPYWGVGIHRAH